MIRTAAAVLVVLVAGAGAWLALRDGPDAPRGGVLGTTASSRPDVAPERVEIGATSQSDLAQSAALQVRAQGPGTLRATVAPAGARPTALGDPVVLRAGAVSVPVRTAAARALARCRPARLTVEVTRGGEVVARRSRTLVPDPPRCGRFFGPSAVWNQRADRAAVDPRSAALVGQLVAQVDEGFAKNFTPTINSRTYSAPIYTVGARQPRVPVQLVGGREAYGQALAAQLAEGVPIPKGARAAWGDDHHLVVWQPATDTMWELWGADDSKGRWEAQWGGRMDGVSGSPGYFSDPSGIQPGATATSLPLAGGLITRADLQRGEINHALAMAIPRSRYAVWALPAQRSDGGEHVDSAIPAGARFRLDPGLDIDALDLPPFTAMLARAAQRYGIYVRDTSPTVTLYAEDPAPFGADPWPAAIKPSIAEVLRAFPWKRLQVTKMDLFTYSNQRVAR